MPRRLATAAAVALCAAAVHSTGADASSVGWSVSIGGPGSAVNVGAPGHWGGGYPGYRGYGGYRPWVRPMVAAPLWSPPPAYPIAGYPLPYATGYGTVYASPYAAPYPAPYAVAAPVVVTRMAPVHVHRRPIVVAPARYAPPHARPY